MIVGDRVKTEDGTGLIVDVEEYSRLKQNRYGIKLDNPRRGIRSMMKGYSPVYYWENEIEKL